MSNNGYKKIISTNYLYLYHLDKFVLLPTYPNSISETLSVTFSSENSLARTAPVYSYSNSGPRNVHISLSLHRDMMNEINTNVSNLKDNVVDFSGDDYVDTLVKYLQAAALPKYKNFDVGARSIIPPMIAVRIGNDIFIKGVIASSINIVKKLPILVDGKYACIDIDFDVSEIDPYTADDVIRDGTFRGITQTFKDGIFNSTSSAISYESYKQTVAQNEDVLNETVTRRSIKYSSRKLPEINGVGRR